MATITFEEFDALLDEAGDMAAATVGYPSPLFVTLALAMADKLILERNITEVLPYEAHQDSTV
jgi:hypothetical protein